MERREFTREFKLETVRLIKERGVGYHRGWREHRAEGSKVIIRRGHNRDRD